MDEDIEEEDINRFLAKSQEYAEFVHDYLEDKDQCPWCKSTKRGGRYFVTDIMHDEDCPVGMMIEWMIQD